jgi:hypothetical protein
VSERRERVAGALAVVIALLGGAALAAGIDTALFEAAPLRAGAFSSADVADLLVPADGEPEVEEPVEASSTTTTSVEVTGSTEVVGSTTSTTARAGAATTTTTTRSTPTAGGGGVSTSSTTTSSTTTTTDKARGRSDENRGRGGPPDD